MATFLVMARLTSFYIYNSMCIIIQLGGIYAHLMCVLVPGLNSGRLAVYSCFHNRRVMEF